MNKLLGTLAILAFASASLAATRTVETTAVGIGAEETSALADALAKAVAQVNGTRSSVNVRTGQTVVESHAEFKTENKSEAATHGGVFGSSDRNETRKNGQSGSADASMTSRTTPDVRMSSSGSIASYEVMSSKKRDDGKYEVTVKAKVTQTVAATYSAPGSASSKTRIAVLPPGSDQPGYEFFGEVSDGQISGELWTAIETSLLRSGAFSVLDRKTLNASLSELGLVASALTNEQEKAKLRKIRGADVVLMPVIHAAQHSESDNTNHLTGQVSHTSTTFIDVEMRAVVPATGEIMFSEQYRLSDASGRGDALSLIAGRASADLALRITGKSIPAIAATPISVRAASTRAPAEMPLPSKAESGVKLPFDR